MTAPLGVAATFSRADAYANGVVLGRDARALGQQAVARPFGAIDTGAAGEQADASFGEDPLLAGGTAKKRYALPNSNIMIHQVLGGAEGQATDVEIRVKYMLKLKQRLNNILAKHTGQPLDVVDKACDRDNFMSPEEAKAFGIVDAVVESRKEMTNLPDRTSVVA